VSGGIFISYRRDDSGAWAERIRERLGSRLGRERVLDADDIGRDADFAGALAKLVGEYDAVILIIGKNWRAKRLGDPGDRVRIAIEVALARNIP